MKLNPSKSQSTFYKNGDITSSILALGVLKEVLYKETYPKAWHMVSTHKWTWHKALKVKPREALRKTWVLSLPHAFQGSLFCLRTLPLWWVIDGENIFRDLSVYIQKRFLQIKLTNPISIQPYKAQLSQEIHIYSSTWGKFNYSTTKPTIMPCLEQFLLLSSGVDTKDRHCVWVLFA